MHRLSQVTAHFTSPEVVDLPEPLAHRLTPPARERFRMLSASDQRHLVGVAKHLFDVGAPVDTVTAGLLHDIGKAVPGITLRLHHRAAKVMLEKTHPGMLDGLRTRSSPPRGMAALWILACHPQGGADLVIAWGYPDRVAWLIANHENTQSADPDLRLLIEADAGRLRPESARLFPYG